MTLGRSRLRLILCCWVLLAGLAAAPSVRPGETLPEADPGRRRVVLLGIDGGDWLAIDPLVSAGRLPTLARLRVRGRTGIMLSTPPLVSPIIWTTIATGRRPEDHGVLDFMVDLPGGGQGPVTSNERRVTALWNIFSVHARSAGVVGWFATWPAEEVRGTIVSDRAAPQIAGDRLHVGAVHPASMAPVISSLLVDPADVTREDLATYVPLTETEYEASRRALADPAVRLYRDPLAHLAVIVARTRSHARAAEEILAQGQPDLLLVYLEVVDSVSHRFVLDRRRGPSAIERAYMEADALLGRLAMSVDPSTWMVVCSDHGFYPADAGIPEDPSDLFGPATAWHRPYGIVGAAEARDLTTGASTSTAIDAGVVTPLDIAPTILHAAGLPVSLEMPGRVVTSLLPADAAARPIAQVASLEPAERTAVTPPAAEHDAVLHARLEALGYVDAGGSSLARLNLGEILYRQGDLAAAERELRGVVEAQPENVSALLWLAKTLGAQGRAREALPFYQRALAQAGDNGDALVEALDLAAGSGLAEEARRILARFAPAVRSTASTAIARSIVANLDGDGSGAERELRTALAADPTSVEALVRLFDRLVGERRPQDLLPAMASALERAPGSARLQALFGSALLAAGQAAPAEERLRRALQLAPDAEPVRIDLARACLAQRRTGAAREVLASAAPSRQRSVLLGVAAAREGQWLEASTHYRAALQGSPETPDLLNGLAYALHRLGRSAEAAELLDRSLALDAAQPEIRRLRAELGQ